MKKTKINDGWKFSYGLLGKLAALVGTQHEKFESVDLPHDFVISTDVSPDAVGGRFTGFYKGNAGTYCKTLPFEKEDLKKRHALLFDGVYRDAQVAVNGCVIGVHNYGYTPFIYDITEYLQPGENTVIVEVDSSREPHSRWYSGGGIYRDVYLLESERRYIQPWSVLVKTETLINGDAVIRIEAKLGGTATYGERITFVLRDPEGKVVETRRFLTRGNDHFSIRMEVEQAKLWSPESPSLYHVDVELSNADGILDTDSVQTGIRTLTLTGLHGLQLNGKTYQIKGGNLHHDNGILGVAAFRDAEYRRVQKMKEAGFNTVRCAHNPPSAEFLNACDELGIMVMNELFDVWSVNTNDADYHLNFDTCWEQDMENAVMRDRNHPSIIMWSIGNEISNVLHANPIDGMILTRKLVEKMRTLDPTRPITNDGSGNRKFSKEEIERSVKDYGKAGVNNAEIILDLGGPFDSMRLDEETFEEYVSMLDSYNPHYVHNCNYIDAEKYPHLPLVPGEMFSSGIDLSWEQVKKYPNIIGDVVWTGWDYLGESGIGVPCYLTEEEHRKVEDQMEIIPMNIPYPTRVSGCGDIDITGAFKPSVAYRRIVWGSRETHISVLPAKYYGLVKRKNAYAFPAVEDSWSWYGDEKKHVLVYVYTAAEKVKLYLNGKLIGEKTAGKEKRYMAVFDVQYVPGVLEAVSYNGDEEVSRNCLVTAGKAAALSVVLEKDRYIADRGNVAYVRVCVNDDEGNTVNCENKHVILSVEGNGNLVGAGSGNPVTEENYTGNEFDTYQGTLIAVIRSDGTKGKTIITASADGVQTGKAELIWE